MLPLREDLLDLLLKDDLGREQAGLDKAITQGCLLDHPFLQMWFSEKLDLTITNSQIPHSQFSCEPPISPALHTIF